MGMTSIQGVPQLCFFSMNSWMSASFIFVVLRLMRTISSSETPFGPGYMRQVGEILAVPQRSFSKRILHRFFASSFVGQGMLTMMGSKSDISTILLHCQVYYWIMKEDVKEEKKYSRNKRLLLLLLLIVFAFLIFRVFGKNDSSAVANILDKKIVLVDCTSTKDAKVSKVDGWNTYLFPAANSDTSRPPEERTGLEGSYSIAKLNGKIEGGNIYYRVELSPRGDLPRDTRKIIEFCDENNKTVQKGSTSDTTVTGASENVQASTSRLAPYYMQNKPGNYRLDGYLFANGKWTLTNRIDQIRLTN